ncbi:hypothetical protein [Micromonospora noduli]|uniref:hypothetical protein n=1 Tax=Micromonospora noduli TaxID=709876 RepID=UPI000DD629B9|nr:hypothetical protein [Micromonospora noduli]
MAAGQRLTRVTGRWMLVLPTTDLGETTVSEENHQLVRRRVFCDRRMCGRCLLRDGHDGACSRCLRR